MLRVATYLLTAIGGIILALGFWYFFEATRFFIASEPAEGVVVDHKSSGSVYSSTIENGIRVSRAIPVEALVVEFRDDNDQSFQFQSSWSKANPLPIGTSVGVRYLERNPHEARITGISSLYGGAFILLVLGGVFFLGGRLAARKARQESSRR